ncbi:MAG TPA: AMP-binding protein [Nocardioides sp.]|uniref:AMP-binding protein n=1 Tax=Nocardioides sp. TaxID=35761 RepID=UPI002BEEBCDC|nr:AMP-binding protein [Nocardioides sp.]HTW14374.1 AMP-binding protein [Nocardioides sp.]
MTPTTAELLLARAEDDNTGLLFEDRRWSWREFVAESAVRAELIRAACGRDGDDPERPPHVGAMLDNVPEYLFLLGGAALAGATLVGVNTTRRGDDLARDIRHTHCDLLVVADEADVAGLDHGAGTVFGVASEEYAAALAEHRGAKPQAHPSALDPATRFLLLFTSGSTGAPKAVICSTGRLAAVSQLNPISFTADDVAYNAMPLFHGNAIMAAWGPCLVSGAAYAMRRRFSASGFLPDVQRFGATFFNYVGRSLAYVLAQPEREGERDNRLRFGFGTEASARDREEFLRRFGCPLFESYGSSEGTIHIVPVEGAPPTALGKPQVGYQADIVAEDGTVCPPARFDEHGRLANPREAIGEIVSRGGALKFEGYYNNPEASADKLRGDDFHTGDLGYRDEDGFFYYSGRTNDWLRVDSENLASGPIEQLIGRHPGIRGVAVYAVPDPHTGDRVMAALETEDGFDPDQFLAFLNEQPDLGSKWTPRLLRLVDELPVTATRKLDKPRLRRQGWDAADVLELRDGRYRPLDDERRRAVAAELAEHRPDLVR